MSIWSNIGKAFGSVLGASAGALGNVAGAGLSYGQQKKLSEHQAKVNYQYAEKSARNTPTWNRAGLETAGYNPMLAVQNSTSGANAGWTSTPSANAPDIAGGFSSGIANVQSFQRLKNETGVAETQAKTNEATAENQLSQAINNLEENKYIGSKRKAEISNITGDTALKEAQIDNMKKRLELDRYINDSGLATTRRGQDKIYNASTYATNVSAETQRGTITEKLPFGFGSTRYDRRNEGSHIKYKDPNDRKYWRNYY